MRLATSFAVLLTVMATPVGAEEPKVKPIDAEFVRADANGDFVIDKVEFLQVALRNFSTTDMDDDDFIESHEMGDQSETPEFLDGDSNKDGKLSVEEVIEEKLADFSRADGNEDGVLNLGEVYKAYKQ